MALGPRPASWAPCVTTLRSRGGARRHAWFVQGVFLDWCSGYQKDPSQFAERHAYEASRSGEEKAAFDRMLENTMVSSRQPISPDRASTCTALTARWLYVPH